MAVEVSFERKGRRLLLEYECLKSVEGLPRARTRDLGALGGAIFCHQRGAVSKPR
jgi:hypothetical protein